MNKRQAWMLGGSVLLYYLLPLFAWAALVPCGNGIGAGNDYVLTSVSCNLCSVGQLIDNLINFLIGISIPIAVLLFGYCGVLLFTSTSNPKQLEHAKKILRSTFIGFGTILGAWLLVEVILHTLVQESYFVDGKWNRISCVSTITNNPGDPGRLINTNIGDVLNNAIGIVSAPQVINAGSLCAQSKPGATYSNNVCVDSANGVFCPTGYTNGPQGCTSSSGATLGFSPLSNAAGLNSLCQQKGPTYTYFGNTCVSDTGVVDCPTGYTKGTAGCMSPSGALFGGQAIDISQYCSGSTCTADSGKLAVSAFNATAGNNQLILKGGPTRIRTSVNGFGDRYSTTEL
jgi:hypothetical protein